MAIADLGAPKGLAIKEYLEADYDELNHSRLYPNLDVLVERGFVAKREKDRRTNSYELTDRGRRVIRANEAWNRQRVGHLLEDEHE
nr:helix-turn-helix transcriptional regulator [Halostella litorea]